MEVYLITGGAGFIGSHFIEYLFRTERELQVVNIDKLTYAGNAINLEAINQRPDYYFYRIDVCDAERVRDIFATAKPDYVINFAAETHVDQSIVNSEPFIRTNVLGTQVLLNCCLEFGVKKFYQVSTDEVYGPSLEGSHVSSFNEESALLPSNPYAASKAAADLLAISYYRTHQLPVIIGRSTNNYGPRQHREKLIPLVIDKCLGGEGIPLYGDGKNKRDWLYVADHCRAIDLLLHKGKPGEIYNISAGNEQENIRVITLILEKIGDTLRQKGGQDVSQLGEQLIRYIADRKGHDCRYLIDSTHLRTELGWKPEMDFMTGLETTIHWYLTQEWR